MPVVPFNAVDFPGSGFTSLRNGNHTQAFSMAEVVWAAVTVGRPGFRSLFQHGRYSYFEVISKVATAMAYLGSTSSGRLEKTVAYNCLDPTEKSAVSYFVGQTMAKLFAAAEFSVPFLEHLSLCSQRLDYSSLKRPDLIGMTYLGEWIVVEAKGRSGTADKKLMDAAKAQTQAVASVNYLAPVLRIAVVASFPVGELRVHLIDPIEPGHGAANLEVPVDVFFRMYYEPFWNLLSGEGVRHYSEGDYLWVPLTEIDLEIGIHRRVHKPPSNAIESPGAFGLDQQFRKEINGLLETLRADRVSTFLGHDGIGIRLGHSWNRDGEANRIEP